MRRHFSSRVLRPLAALIFTAAAAQSPLSNAGQRLQGIRARLQEARARSDWPTALAAAREQVDFLHGYPRALLELARTSTQAGDLDSALRVLRQYARMGQVTAQLDRLPEFAALRTIPQYAALAHSIQSNLAPVSHTSQAVSISDTGLLPEDVDYDTAGHRFLVSSIREHKIISVTAAGAVSDFAAAPEPWPVMALRIDAARHLVWATEVALDGFTSVSKDDSGRSAILAFDLGTGKLLRRVESLRGTALGDMTLAPNGDLVVSDGQSGGVYHLAAGGDALDRIDSGDFISPQTPAFLPGGHRVFIPDYLRGIAVLDVASHHVTWLATEGKYALSGIDGLYLHERRLVAIQNGTSPERVVVFALDASLSRIVSESIVEESTPNLGDPTHGVFIGNDFYFIANSGWDALDDHGDLLADAKLSASHLLRTSLR